MDRRRPIGVLIFLLTFALGLLGTPVAAGEVPAGERFPAPYGYDAPADALAHAPEGPRAQGALLQAPGSAKSAAVPAVAADGAATTSSVLTYTPSAVSTAETLGIEHQAPERG